MRVTFLMTDKLDQAASAAQQYLALKHAARERALPKSRTAIRYCANSIRATHRQEFQAAAELLRYLLDQLRRGNIETCETLLGYMDDIYALLITIDYPDAITGGLRRTTDAARGILEKTRGDLTIAVGQDQLQQTLLTLQRELEKLRLDSL